MGLSFARSRRILAIWLPRLATDRLRRLDRSGSPDERPLATITKVANALRLDAVNAVAARQGLHRGMTLADARAIHPGLSVVEADREADRRLLDAIADWCDRWTPLVAVDPPDGLCLDVTGCAHLFKGEAALVEEAKSRLARQGFTVGIALAGNAVAARALARCMSGMIVAPGDPADVIAPLPIAAFGFEPDVMRALSRAGLNRIGDLLCRSRSSLASRFGQEFVDLLDQAQGRSEAPLIFRRPLPSYVAERRFAEPIATHAVALAMLTGLAQTLATILEQHQQGARRLEAVFFRVDGAVFRIAVETGQPVRDPAAVQRLFRERLDALSDPLDPGFGFDLIRLEATHVEAFTAMPTSFDEPVREDGEVAALIDRLSARFGSRRIVRFAPNDTHVPELTALPVPAQRADQVKDAGWMPVRDPDEPPRRPVRLFAKPERIEAEVEGGAPVRFRWRRARHEIAQVDGPERIAMAWWRSAGNGLARDYFRVEDRDGRRYWLYREMQDEDRAPPRWFLHGLFA